VIIATVTTCPRRWREYQRLRKNFDSLRFPFPLRTFQSSERLDNPYANHILNARAALAFCARHLPVSPDNWVLYLEDDVVLHPELAGLLERLCKHGAAEQVDCWYLCNRQNSVRRREERNGLLLHELAHPIYGSHGLLIPARHLRPLLDAHWTQVADVSIFRALDHPGRELFKSSVRC
jgi:hypothetical protein